MKFQPVILNLASILTFLGLAVGAFVVWFGAVSVVSSLCLFQAPDSCVAFLRMSIDSSSLALRSDAVSLTVESSTGLAPAIDLTVVIQSARENCPSDLVAYG